MVASNDHLEESGDYGEDFEDIEEDADESGEQGEEEEEEEEVLVDEEPGGDEEQERLLDALIAEEHQKFRAGQAQWQEKVRAARPWSAPPLGSPSLQEQRQREAQAAAMHANGAMQAADAVPRGEYQPPDSRPFLERAAAKGGSPVAHMAPPRPTSADSVRRYRSATSAGATRASGLLQDIMEDSPLEDKSGGFLSRPKQSDSSLDSPTASVPAGPGAEGESSQGDGVEDTAGSIGGRAAASGSDEGAGAVGEEVEAEDGALGHLSGEVHEEVSFGELTTASGGGAQAADATTLEAGERASAAAGEDDDKLDSPSGSAASLSFAVGGVRMGGGGSAAGYAAAAAHSPASAPPTPTAFRQHPWGVQTFGSPVADERGPGSTSSSPQGEGSPRSPGSVHSPALSLVTVAEPQQPQGQRRSPKQVPPVVMPTTVRAKALDMDDTDQGAVDEEEEGVAEDSEGGQQEEGGTGQEVGDDYGDMLAPHAFALQLLAHDLRTLPASQALAVADVQARGGAGAAAQAPPPKLTPGQFGFLGLQGPEFAVPSPWAAPAAQQQQQQQRMHAAAAATAPLVQQHAVPAPLRPATAPVRRSSPAPDTLRNTRYPLYTPPGRQQQQQRALDAEAAGQSMHAVRTSQALRSMHVQSLSSPGVAGALTAADEDVLQPPSVEQQLYGLRYEAHAATGAGFYWDADAGASAALRRPASAGPAYGSGGGSAAAAPRAAANGGIFGVSAERTALLVRPQSAQPVLSSYPEAAWVEGGGPGTLGRPTAAVVIGGRSVSVYVAETSQQIMEANGWLAALGGNKGRGYRLKTPHSNMLVQMVEERESYGEGVPAVRVLKTMSLKTFLAVHRDLRGRAAQERRQAQREERRQAALLLRERHVAEGLAGGGAGRQGWASRPVSGQQQQHRHGQRPKSAAPAGGGGPGRKACVGAGTYGWLADAQRKEGWGSGGEVPPPLHRHALSDVPPAGRVIAYDDDARHLLRVTAAAARAQELSEQVAHLRQLSVNGKT